MDGFPIRVGVRGVMIQDQKVLLVKIIDETGMHFNYPGGEVKRGESLHEALKREIKEETCVDVTIGRLLMVWEYVPEKANYRYGEIQKLSLLFLCHILPDQVAQLPRHPDPNQVDVTWVKLGTLKNLPVIPNIGDELARSLRSRSATGNLFLNKQYE
ncbi:MAG: NUDIX domain-containing protein [Anaerolineaceae bacterium]|nr:NUDIX domain-containing protein [Anaerolineaceae bacterium]